MCYSTCYAIYANQNTDYILNAFYMHSLQIKAKCNLHMDLILKHHLSYPSSQDSLPWPIT